MLQAEDGTNLIEGQRVKKGDVIVRLDSTLLRANLDKLEAYQEELAEQTKQAGIALTSADKEVERLAKLKDDKLVSQVDVAKAHLTLQDAQSKYQSSKLREKTGLKDIHVLREQIKLLTLTTPIDGRLGRLLVVPGQTIASGALVADIVDIDEWIDVLCFVPPVVLKKLARGQPARVGGLEDHQDGPADAEGKIEYIANQAEVDTGNFAIKIRFPNKALGLHANTSQRVRVLTTPGKACLTLPESALLEDQQPPAVVVVDNYKLETKDGKDVETGEARKLQVKVGIRDRTLHLVEIIGLVDPENKWRGNLEEARFVIERGRGLRNGDPIRLQVDED
jgi:RND family efflux transporter MFP subunit